MEWAAIIAAFATLSLAVTKSVDLVRNGLDPNAKFPPVTWNVVAFVFGVAYCLGWQIDLTGEVLRAIPAFAGHADRLTGVAGQVLTGVVLGGVSGFWHDLLKLFSSYADKARASV